MLLVTPLPPSKNSETSFMYQKVLEMMGSPTSLQWCYISDLTSSHGTSKLYNLLAEIHKKTINPPPMGSMVAWIVGILLSVE